MSSSQRVSNAAARHTQSTPLALVWAESGVGLAFSSVISIVLALLLTSPSLNDFGILQALYIERRPISISLEIVNFLMLLLCGLGVYAYRTIRRRGNALARLAAVSSQLAAAVLYYQCLLLFSDYLFPVNPNAIFLSTFHFTTPAPDILAATSIILLLHAFINRIRIVGNHTISPRAADSNTMIGSIPHETSAAASLPNLHSAMKSLLVIAYTVTVLEMAFLIAYSHTAFSDIGAAILLGTFVFWIAVVIYNTIIIRLNRRPWRRARRHSAFLGAYSIVVTLILFFYCNDAGRWSHASLCIIALLSCTFMILHRDQFKYQD